MAIHGFLFGFSGVPHGHGIAASSTGHVIEGNHLGTDAGGTSGLGNGGAGVFLEVGASTVGGTTPAARNVASGNTQNGVAIWNFSDGNVVQGNYLGTTPDGTAALPNNYGITLYAGANSTIGGTVAGAGNVLSGNNFDGLSISNPNFPIPTLVQGNLLGLDATGTSAVGNGSNGIGNTGTGATGAVGITVGGTTPTAGNTCSGNMRGISYQGSDWLVQGNRVGTDLSGTVPLGNSRAGITIFHTTATNSTIGGIIGSSANLIAYNNTSGLDSGGVVVNFSFTGADPTNNSVLGNSIVDNTGLGISLCDGSPCDGVTANDPLDPDVGPNGLQNFPVITSADAETGDFAGTLNSTESTSYRVELFANHACDPSGHGEGELFLAAVDPVTTDGSGDVAFADTTTPFLAGLELAATATA
ncbi:MAG: hypothetical protein K8H90_06100, partial [Thermoanaerobaculia bacterium]|nr:hypothetical protein [Thermoanaerobaculia bacterium]